jgi:hypothetical protein
MEDYLFWLILIALTIVIGNQIRERQERETKRMTKKQKEKYFNDIKKRQKEAMIKVLWAILIIFIIGIFLLFSLFF